ncbi:hypothetical protein SAMN04515674_109149 [Pseudarcicella hirudinis]|uniref:Uncharacterized protein n=1 Tax=Pseudarcicella hirudinis TaxID=1079859 RepID=A0A1I5VJ14_9BACT|nr:hypothetical protein [Pseudarcicella hirudinis]SFQ07459.1 hypothetical protein SAMN04515674_109149 [Pseudarcicella hirudinis]
MVSEKYKEEVSGLDIKRLEYLIQTSLIRLKEVKSREPEVSQIQLEAMVASMEENITYAQLKLEEAKSIIGK